MSDQNKNQDQNDPSLGAEIMDRAERKAQKQKERAEKLAAKPPKQKKQPDEIDAALSASKLGNEQKAKKKQYMKLAMYGAIGCVVLWLGAFLFIPYQAGPTFGVCRVFLENQIRFPQDLKLGSIEEDLRPLNSTSSLGGIRIWYTQLDEFGEYRLENIECYFKNDEKLGTQIDIIKINRRQVDPEKVKAFNNVLPVVMQNLPDLTYPDPLPTNLEDLQIKTDLFRKKIF